MTNSDLELSAAPSVANTPKANDASTPRIWALLGDKLGDNAQVQAIVGALGFPTEVKHLHMRAQWELGKPRFTPSLDHIDHRASDKLEPPWPELIITIGRRLSQAALWVKEQSGNRTKIALVGRPKRWPGKFDLVIGPPQYQLPDAPNIVHLSMPLMRPDSDRIAREVALWSEQLSDLARPLTAVFVGGQTRPFRFDGAVADTLARELKAVKSRDGGSLFVSTSRRTTADVATALRQRLGPEAKFFSWGQNDGAENPYHALLGLADRFVVTQDSISMIVESIHMHRPVAIFALPKQMKFLDHMIEPIAKALAPGGFLGDSLRRIGLLGYSRDLEAFRKSLIGSGLAVPLGEPFSGPSEIPPDDLDFAVKQVRALISV